MEPKNLRKPKNPRRRRLSLNHQTPPLLEVVVVQMVQVVQPGVGVVVEVPSDPIKRICRP